MVVARCWLFVDVSGGGRAREGDLRGVVAGVLVWIPVEQKNIRVSIIGIGTYAGSIVSM